jgi:hypothetical protein
MMQKTSDQDLWALVTARFEQSMSTPEAFFTAESEKIAEACWAMALCRTTLEQSGKPLLAPHCRRVTFSQWIRPACRRRRARETRKRGELLYLPKR